jgi:hypothetical protein
VPELRGTELGRPCVVSSGAAPGTGERPCGNAMSRLSMRVWCGPKPSSSALRWTSVIAGTPVLGWGLDLGRLRARDGLAVRPAGPGQTREDVGHGQAERPSRAAHRSSPEVIVTRQGPDR